MRVAARILLRVGVVLAVAVLAILALERVLTRLLPLQGMVEEFAAELGRPVQVTSMQVRLLPFPRAHFEGVRMEPDGFIDRADVELRIAPFLRGGIERASAHFRGVRMTLRRRADGSLAYGGTEPEDRAPGEAASDAGAPALPPLPRVELRDVLFTFQDEAALGGTHTVTAFLSRATVRTRHEADAATLEAKGHLGTEPGADTFHARFDLGPAPPGGRRVWTLDVRTRGIDPAEIVPHLPAKWGFRSARGSLDAHVAVARDEEGVETGGLDLAFSPGAVDYAGVALDGRIVFRSALRDAGGFELSGARAEADRLVLGPIDARNLKGRFRYGKGRLDFADLAFETWGGRVEARLAVEPSSGPVAFETTLEVTGLAVHELPRASGPSEPTPVPPEEETFLDGSGNFRGHWTGGSDWMAGIEGEGRVALRGGSMPAGKVLASAFRKLIGPVRGDRASGATTPLEGLGANLTLAEGRARISDLKLQTGDYRIEGAGNVGSLGDLELQGKIHFDATVLRWLARAPPDERGSGRPGGYPGVPFELSGRLGDAEYELRFTEGTRTTVVLVPRAVGELTGTTTAPLGLGRRAFQGALGLFRSEPDSESEAEAEARPEADGDAPADPPARGPASGS